MMANTYLSRVFDDVYIMPWVEANNALPTRPSEREVVGSLIDGGRVSDHWREARQKLILELEQRNEFQGFDFNGYDNAEGDISSVDGYSVSDEWRRIGEARRKLILDIDRQNGGRDFNINKSCDVARYFQVAQRALEQFHRMYREGGELEEAYVMGYRMVGFLTDCLPTHPGYRQPSVAHLRKQCLWELDHLQICLHDLALTIDEVHCNKFAEEFDPLVYVGDDDDDSDSEDAEVSAAASTGWADFGDTKRQNPQVESPTTTVDTSGTSSLEAADCYFLDDSMPERKIDFSDDEDSPAGQSFLVELGTDFLKKVANEEVEYESDSEAADSWAQDEDAKSCTSSFSLGQGEGIICDPARIAFRDLMRHVPRTHPFIPLQSERCDGSITSSEDTLSPPRRPDPPVQVCRIHFVEKSVDKECRSFRENDRNFIRQRPRESAVACEIQRFLDASFEYDPSRVVDSSIEQLSTQRTCPPRRYTHGGSGPFHGSAADLPMAPANKENVIFPADDGWVSFGSVRESEPRSYRVRA